MKQECVEEEVAFLSKKILELNKQLMESENAKSKFLSLVANELNNPMTVILRMIEHLKIVEDESNRKTFELICEEVLNLDFRIQNLMSAAEIESGDIHPSHELVSLEEIIEEVLKTLRYLIDNKNAQVVVANRVDKKVVLDSQKLFIILRNLLSNAALYGSQNERIELETMLEGDFLVLRVTNEGEGPDIEYKPQIFTRFAKAPKAESGLGVGLSIVRELALYFGGTIDYEVCQGSVVFTVKLLLDAAAEDSVACGSNEFFFDSFDDAIEL
jgi:signal transduction histidine kinase